MNLAEVVDGPSPPIGAPPKEESSESVNQAHRELKDESSDPSPESDDEDMPDLEVRETDQNSHS